MTTLAILGGTPVITTPLPFYNSIGSEEISAANKVLKSGQLSNFVGAWGDAFFGGVAVREMESEWCRVFSVRHSVSVNSATSALYAAVGAIGVGPGDEVIVPPYTMSATAMAPLIYGGIPVFVDIEPDTFCLDPVKVRESITPRTRAIIAVNLFGHPAPLAELRQIADDHELKLIEDNAQSPLSTEHGRYAGTVGHIGVFSLNYHKHFHTGEGGVCVTDDDELALRMQMIRNHGENIVDYVHLDNLANLIGFNYRMTELCAAIGLEQLKKAEHHIGRREVLAERLTEAVSGLDGLTAPLVRRGCRHVYYVWAMKYDEIQVGVSRAIFSRALTAEGFPNSAGYVKPLYLLPVFQHRVAIGGDGFPFSLSNRVYSRGLCPVSETLHERRLLEFHICSYDVDSEQTEKLIEALHKVYKLREKLKVLDTKENLLPGQTALDRRNVNGI